MSKCVSAYNPISDKTITICLWEIPINMTIIELNSSDDNSADEFCGWLRESYDKTPRKIPSLYLGPVLRMLEIGLIKMKWDIMF